MHIQKLGFSFFFQCIWILTAVIIVSSHYSTLASRLSGNNAVQVLATLFLLSYTKLLRLVITVFSVTEVPYPDGYIKLVWLFDGNTEYLKGKHIPLFIATILLLTLLSIPYTFSLINIQWLQKISHYRAMSWIHKLKPLFDAYTGPYKAAWSSLLDWTSSHGTDFNFSPNRHNNPTTNLFIIVIFLTFLIIWLCFTQWVYKDLLNNFLEIFFLCNLIITSTAMLFEFSKGRHSPAVMITSTGLALIAFIVITLYHAQWQLFRTRTGQKLKKKMEQVFHLQGDHLEEIQLQTDHHRHEFLTRLPAQSLNWHNP